jgi:hypothetical protein
MPAAQGEVANREVRFTLRFRRTITIVARSVSSSFVTGRRDTPRHDGFQPMIERRAASATIRDFTGRCGYRIRERRRAWNNRWKRSNRLLRMINDESGKTLAPDV